jgi:hypothetical protein
MWRTASDVSASRISLPGWKKVSRPGQLSLITGTPQAAASNRRTLGEKPAAAMSGRVRLSV